jgi:1-deoxy-D-xylulose-5-phosphate reductoisomerase
MRRVIVLGSTGSVGTQALDLISQFPERFEVVGLSANSSVENLRAQAEQFAVPAGNLALGAAEAAQLVRSLDAEVVVHGINGSAGLDATIAALETGKTLALANKESLIVGGTLVKNLAKPGQIVPVDSEHSALAQALHAGSADEVSRLILTASGGPFRGLSRERLAGVSVEQALKHPTWSMGKVITINSASMVNKGLELIEAHLLFDIPIDRIAITVHPQSIVHSMVEYVDGSVIAQCSITDMKLPIALALDWPNRQPGAIEKIDWAKSHSWQFEPLDESVFQAVPLAREAALRGLTYPAIYNAANEQAVEAFLSGRIGFTEITAVIDRAIEAHTPDAEMTLDGVLAAESWAREVADELIAQVSSR